MKLPIRGRAPGSFTGGLAFLPFFILSITGVLVSSGHAQSLSLRQALDATLKNHPSVAISSAEARAENGRRLQALSPPAPEFTYHEEEIRDGDGLGTGDNRQFIISQAFDFSHLLGARAWKHGDWSEALAHRRESVHRELRASVIIAYATLRIRHHQTLLRREALARAHAYTETIEHRLQAGEITTLATTRARAEESRTHLALLQAETEQRSAASELAALTGLPINETSVLTDSVEIRYTAPILDSPDSLTNRHPQIREAEWMSKGWRSEIAARWLQILPGFRAAWMRQRIGSSEYFWGAELSVSVPIWFLLDTRGQVMEARAEADRAEAEARLLRLIVYTRIQRALDEVHRQEQSLTIWHSRFLPEAKALQEQARIGRESGAIDYLEYFDAVHAADELLYGYSDALLSYTIALARLEQDAGIILIP